MKLREGDSRASRRSGGLRNASSPAFTSLNIRCEIQSSTEKEVSCPALVEKRGRAGGSEDLPRFPRLWRACRWVQALPNPACEFFLPSELDLRRFILIVLRQEICEASMLEAPTSCAHAIFTGFGPNLATHGFSDGALVPGPDPRSLGEALGGFWGDSGGEGWGNSGKDG